MKNIFKLFLLLVSIIQVSSAAQIYLTETEKNYIKNNPTIKVQSIVDSVPYNFIEDGKPQGYSLAHIKLIASKVGLNVDIVLGNSWNQSMELLKNNKIDVMPNIVKTKVREEYFSFTSPYTPIMNALFVKEGNFHPKSLNDLNGKTLSVVKGFSEVPLLKKYYPKIKLHYTNNGTEAFKLLSLGKVDATSYSIGAGHKIILKNGLINVHPEFEIKDKIFQKNMHIATNKNNEILRNILEKGLNSLTSKEKNDLSDKWLKPLIDKNTKKSNDLIDSLSKDEKQWIKNNPIIRVHNETNWPPYNFNQDGKPLGYSIDTMNLVAKKTGLQVKYITGPTWNQFLDKMKDGSLDVMLNIVKTPERLKYLAYTPPYADNPNAIISKKETQYKNIESLFEKTVALPKGFFTQEVLEKEYPQIKLLLVNNVLEAMKAVTFGKADAALGELAVFNHLLNEHMMTSLVISGEANMGNPEYSLLNIATQKDKLILSSILSKGVDSITSLEKKELQKKWLGDYFTNKIKLTADEKKYLSSKKDIKMCVHPNILPLEEIDKNGKHQGISKDIIQLVSKKINKPVVLVSTKTWAQSQEKFNAKECDIIPLSMKIPSHQKYMNFTKPYITDSIVVATKNDKFFIKDSSDLADKKIGIIKDFAFIELIKQKYPDIEIITVNNIKDGLKMVQNEELFGYVSALPLIAYNIQKEGMIDLKVAGKLEFDLELSMASRQDEPLLNSIIQKALNDIKQEQIRTIMGKWIAIKVEQSFDYRKLIYISLFFLAILAVIVYKNRSISKLNRQLLELSITDNLTKLYNRNKLDEVLIEESNRANRFDHIFGVIIIDIDYFKSVNDIHGHQMGDTVLKEFADILKFNSRKTDTVGRWGGEEFLIICSETNLDGILSFANTLKEKISSYPFALGEQKTASFGVSVYKKDENVEDMIKRADDALYEAKENGRNKVECL